jgi:hypothetical protein
MLDTKQHFIFSYSSLDEAVVVDVTFDKGGGATTYDVFQKFLGFMSTAYGYPVTEADLLEARGDLE